MREDAGSLSPAPTLILPHIPESTRLPALCWPRGPLTSRSWRQCGSAHLRQSQVSQDGLRHYVDSSVPPALILLPLSPKCRTVWLTTQLYMCVSLETHLLSASISGTTIGPAPPVTLAVGKSACMVDRWVKGPTCLPSGF